MVLDEIGHVVDNTGDGDEGLAILGLGDVVVPVDDGELVEGRSPVELGTLLVELLLELLNSALFNLVGTELLEVVGKAKLLGCPDEPLGWVVLPPLNGISEIRWEFVVEVVVALAKRDQCGEEVVTWGVLVVVWRRPEPVCERVDGECRLRAGEVRGSEGQRTKAKRGG